MTGARERGWTEMDGGCNVSLGEIKTRIRASVIVAMHARIRVSIHHNATCRCTNTKRGRWNPPPPFLLPGHPERPIRKSIVRVCPLIVRSTDRSSSSR